MSSVNDRPLARVLYVVVLDPSTVFGSLHEQIVYLSRAFARENAVFLPLFVVPRSACDDGTLRPLDIPAECLDLRRFRVDRAMKLGGLIDTFRIAVVHWNFTEPLANPYLWWLSVRYPHVRHFYTDHISRSSGPATSRATIKEAVKRRLLRRFAKILCVSEFVLDIHRRQGHAHVVLLRHFVNTDRFRPDATMRAHLRRTLDVDDRFVALIVAHLIPEKGIDTVLEAIAALPDRVVLWIVGEGPERDHLAKRCAALAISPRVRFHGAQRDVSRFMQAADCLVCPSRWAEAVGLVNLEASASGLPVVASRVGGIPEYIDDGRTGLLFDPCDSRGLAACLGRLVEDIPFREMVGRQARDRALADFSPKRVDEFLDVYRS